MNRWVVVFLIYFTSFSIQGQNNLTETEKLYSLCKVWGYLKFYHPVIAKGKIDWDKQLTIKIPEVEALSTKKELSNLYMKWINSLGEIKGCSKCGPFKNEDSGYNFNLTWIEDEKFYTTELKDKLKFIENNRYGKTHHYFTTNRAGNVKFTNLRTENVENFPSYEVRLQDVFNFWNSVEYFFPYKYEMDRNWDSVLVEVIPKIKYANDSFEYQNAYFKLLQSMNDGHVGNPFPAILTKFGKGFYGVRLKIFDKQAVISEFYMPEKAKSIDLRIGDEVVRINGKKVSELIDERNTYTMGSNENTHQSYLGYLIQRSNQDSLVLEIKRNQKSLERVVKRINFKTELYIPSDSVKWRVLDDNIGYINLNYLEKDDVDNAMQSLMSTKAIIFDNRGYPNGTLYMIAAYLNNERKDFAKFTLPDEYYPGKFVWAPSITQCGQKNGKKYNGKVIILVNETTQSHAEFTCMCLQTHENSITIGSQTAGADGNVSNLYLLGKRVTHMSGIGVYYPNGTPTQRIGVKIDIEVRPTIQGLVNGKDEVLDKAIEIAKAK